MTALDIKSIRERVGRMAPIRPEEISSLCSRIEELQGKLDYYENTRGLSDAPAILSDLRIVGSRMVAEIGNLADWGDFDRWLANTADEAAIALTQATARIEELEAALREVHLECDKLPHDIEKTARLRVLARKALESQSNG